MRRLLKPLWIFLALIFLLEAWLWDHLEPVVARVVNVIPWKRLKSRLAKLVDKLPPRQTLVVFVVPLAVLVPLKVLALWLVAQHHWIAAAFTLLFAKLLGLGITAFIFDVTRDKLLQIEWFRWLYDRVLMLRDWAHDIIEPIKRRLRRLLKLARRGPAGAKAR
jgi:hypothetical protein